MAMPSTLALWDRHKQKLLFSLPADFASEAERRFGVKY